LQVSNHGELQKETARRNRKFGENLGVLIGQSIWDRVKSVPGCKKRHQEKKRGLKKNPSDYCVAQGTDRVERIDKAKGKKGILQHLRGRVGKGDKHTTLEAQGKGLKE